MSNILTDWRQALVTHLKANLQAGAWADDPSGLEHVKSGERDEPVKDRKLAVVFAPPLAEDSGDIDFARPALLVRAWLPRSKQPRPVEPPDPEPIEQLMVDLMSCLQPVQSTLLTGRLVFRVASVVPDYDDWGVQATLTGWTGNPATVGEL